MKELKRLLYLFSLVLVIAACGGDGDDDGGGNDGGNGNVNKNNVNRNIVINEKAVGRLEFPRLKGGNSKVLVYRVTDNSSYDKDRVNYCVEWDCDKKSQRWSCYQLHKGYGGGYSRVIIGTETIFTAPVSTMGTSVRTQTVCILTAQITRLSILRTCSPSIASSTVTATKAMIRAKAYG